MWNFWIDRASRRAASRLVAAVFGGGRVVHEDLHGPPVVHRQDLPRFGRAPHPSQPTIVRPVDRPGRVEAEPPASRPPPASAMPPSRTPRRDTRPTRTPARPPTERTDGSRTRPPHTGDAEGQLERGPPDRGQLAWLPVGNTLLLPTGRQGRWRLWGTSAAICATSSSTSSRSSACRSGPAGPDVDTDPDTLRDLLRELDRAGHRPARRGLRRRRPAPAGVRPRHAHRHRSRAGEAGLPRCCGTASGGGSGLPAELGGLGVPPTRAVGRGRADPRRQPGGVPLPRRPAASPRSCTASARRSSGAGPS